MKPLAELGARVAKAAARVERASELQAKLPDSERDFSRGGEAPVELVCSTCARKFWRSARIERRRQREKPGYAVYCSWACQHKGIRGKPKPLHQLPGVAVARKSSGSF